MERLDACAKKVLHASWKEANNITERAEKEAAKYRMSAEEVVKNAEKKGNFLINASFAMIETAKTQAKRIKDDAVTHYNAEEGKVREIKERIEEVKKMREEKKKNELEKESKNKRKE